MSCGGHCHCGLFLLLITRQAAQLICLGCTINNIGVHVTVNRSVKKITLHNYVLLVHVIITNWEKKRLSVKGMDYSACMHVTIQHKVTV